MRCKNIMKTIEVVAAIIKKDNEIFITRRGYGEFVDMWEFPGGKIEEGESREEALHREIREELEVEIDDLQFLTTVDYDYPTFHLTMHCFTCKMADGKVHLNAHNDAKWIGISELRDQNWVPADVIVVNELISK